MGEENKSAITKGCIKATRGPWLVRRTDKDGRVVTKLRFPSERERLKNKQREKRRRDVRRRIFEGLRAHGNYGLPKHADGNDFLVALCEDAGWHVEEDGTIFRRKVHSEARTSSSCATSSENIGHGNCVEYGHIMKANEVIQSKIGSPPSVNDEHDRDVNLTLSL